MATNPCSPAANPLAPTPVPMAPVIVQLVPSCDTTTALLPTAVNDPFANMTVLKSSGVCLVQTSPSREVQMPRTSSPPTLNPTKRLFPNVMALNCNAALEVQLTPSTDLNVAGS